MLLKHFTEFQVARTKRYPNQETASQPIPRNPEMKSRQKRCPQEASNKIPVTPSSNVEEDGSDVDKNFTLLTGRYGRQTGKSSSTREEEKEFSSDEDDEGSAPSEEESGDDEEDGDSEAPDEEEVDHDGGVGTSEIQTREDIKKGEFHCW